MNFTDYCLYTKDFSTLETIGEYSKLFTDNNHKFGKKVTSGYKPSSLSKKLKKLSNKLKDITGITKLNRINNSIMKNTIDEDLRQKIKRGGKLATLYQYITNKDKRREINNTLKDVNQKKKMMLEVKNPTDSSSSFIKDKDGKIYLRKGEDKSLGRLWNLKDSEYDPTGIGFNSVYDQNEYFKNSDDKKFYNDDIRKKIYEKNRQRAVEEGKKAEDALIKTIRGLKRTKNGGSGELTSNRAVFDNMNEGIRNAFKRHEYFKNTDSRAADYEFNPNELNIAFNTMDSLNKYVKNHESHKRRIKGEEAPVDYKDEIKKGVNNFRKVNSVVPKNIKDYYNLTKQNIEKSVNDSYKNATPNLKKQLIDMKLEKLFPGYSEEKIDKDFEDIIKRNTQSVSNNYESNKHWNTVKDSEGQLAEKSDLSDIRKILAKKFGGENVFGKYSTVSRDEVRKYLDSMDEKYKHGMSTDEIISNIYNKTDRRYSE